MGIAKAYLVAGTQYARYDVATNQMDPGLGYPKGVVDGGPNGGWALQGTPMELGFDTAMDDGYGKVWFFRDDLCLRADNHTRAVDRGPLSIADAFPGLADVGMASGLTAVANWLDERAYVVRGADCVAYDLVRREVLWGPTPLATEFEGLAEAGFAEPRALSAWPGASAYALANGSYVRIDRATGRVDAEPLPVFGNWPGLPEDFCGQVTAVWPKTELVQSVGRRGDGAAVANEADDQRHVARLLDRVPVFVGGSGTGAPTAWTLPEDGVCADDLAEAVVTFQTAQALQVDGHVDPADQGGSAIGRLIDLADSPALSPVEIRLAELAATGVDLGAVVDGLGGELGAIGRRFENGLLVGMSSGGAALLRGGAVGTWLGDGDLMSGLGPPLEDTVDLAAVRISLFEGGALLESLADGGVFSPGLEVALAVLASAWDPGDMTGEVVESVGPDGSGTGTGFTEAVVLERGDGPTTVTVPALFDGWAAGLTGDRPDLADLGWPLGDAMLSDDGSARQTFAGGTVLRLAADGTVTSELPILGPDADLTRFLVHRDPARLLESATSDNEVTPFIGARSCFADMASAIKSATGPKDFIYLLGWHCNIDLELVPGDPTTVLKNLLETATRDGSDHQGAEVRMMLWHAKEQPPSTGALVWEGIRGISIAKVLGRPPLNWTNYRTLQVVNTLAHSVAILDNETLMFGSHHQKVLIVKAGDRLVAYVGGMDLNADRLHPNGVKGSASVGAPLHDVHIKIEGPGAVDLLATFTRRWKATKESGPTPLRSDSFAPAGGVVSGPNLVQISHTYGRGYPYPFAVQTGKEVLVNALRSARVYAYMECQYFVGNEELRLALRKALATVSEAVIVVMAPLEAVGDLEQLDFRRKRFIAPLKNDFPDKLLVFEHLGQPLGRTTPGAYIHAKLMLVDDEAAFIGTLNYSRRSWTHDSEVMATIVDSRGPAGLPPLPGFAAQLRESLWAEYLTVTPPELRDISTAVQKLRNLPSGAHLAPYDHNQVVGNPRGGDPLWNIVLDPPG